MTRNKGKRTLPYAMFCTFLHIGVEFLRVVGYFHFDTAGERGLLKIHRTLRMSPAMAAGVTDRLWEVNDLVVL